MKFQAFHVNPGEKLKKKDVNNDLSNFMSVFPSSSAFTRVSNGVKNKPVPLPDFLIKKSRYIRDF